MEILIQISGWLGTILIVSAYFLLSRKKITGQSKTYQFLNLVGAVTLGIAVFHQGAWSALALNVVWATIAIVTLVKVRQNSRKGEVA